MGHVEGVLIEPILTRLCLQARLEVAGFLQEPEDPAAELRAATEEKKKQFKQV